MRPHRHKMKTRKIQVYTGSVTSEVTGYYKQNRAAHGGICYVDTCSCGAVRKTNSNGRHEERGRWHGGPYDRDDD